MTQTDGDPREPATQAGRGAGPAASSVLSRITKLSDLIKLGAQALDDCMVRTPRYEYRQYPACIKVTHYPDGDYPHRRQRRVVEVDFAGAVLAMHYDGIATTDDGSYRYLRKVPMATSAGRDVYDWSVQDAMRQMVITAFEAKRLEILEDLFNHRMGDALAKLDPATWAGTPGPHTHEERLRREALADQFFIKPNDDAQALVSGLLAETVPAMRALGI